MNVSFCNFYSVIWAKTAITTMLTPIYDMFWLLLLVTTPALVTARKGLGYSRNRTLRTDNTLPIVFNPVQLAKYYVPPETGPARALLLLLHPADHAGSFKSTSWKCMEVDRGRKLRVGDCEQTDENSATFVCRNEDEPYEDMDFMCNLVSAQGLRTTQAAEIKKKLDSDDCAYIDKKKQKTKTTPCTVVELKGGGESVALYVDQENKAKVLYTWTVD